MATPPNNKSANVALPQNPHRRLHNTIFAIAVVLLTGQVLEGALLIPFVAVYFGWPTLTLTEVCSEMVKMAYADEDRYCEFPVPLFQSVPEPWLQKNVDHIFPPATPPRPNFERLGFREVLEVRERRMQRKAAEAEAAKSQDPLTTAESPPQGDIAFNAVAGNNTNTLESAPGDAQ